MRRSRVTCASFALIVAAGASDPLAGQSVEDQVDALLEYSELESILISLPDEVHASLAQLNSDPLPEAASAALDRHLSTEALTSVMKTEFAARGDPEIIAAAAQLVDDGAIASAQDIAREQEPSGSLEEYAAALNANPPPQSRIQLVAQIAAAQFAGDFFVILNERTREASHIIAAAVWGDTPPYQPPSDEELMAQAQQNLMGAVVAFLYQYQAVDDALLGRVLEEWSSEAGSWYSEAYTLALADTLIVAAEAIAAEIAPL